MKPKGYYTWNAYMGYVPSANTYWQFEDEAQYIEFLRERSEI